MIQVKLQHGIIKIRPVAHKGYGSRANETKPQGKGSHKNYCFSITQLVGQKKQ